MINVDALRNAAPYTTEYTLSLEDNQRIFRNEIIPAELAHAAPQDSPVVVFLVGQQGAGKTRISHQIAQRLDTYGGFVDIDSDLYKPYHPAYQQLLLTNDRDMAHHTRPDARRWMFQAEAYVRGDKPSSAIREPGINALVQETAQDPNTVVRKLRDYQSTHRVEVAVLAVPKAMSLQGILHRYHEQCVERGHGRLTEPARRDLSYNGILDLADHIDAHGLAHKVAVYRRGEAKPRYDNNYTATGWQNPPRLRQAIETERNRPWTAQETADFVRVHAYLLDQMDPEFQSELHNIAELAQPLLHPSIATGSSAAELAQQGFPESLRTTSQHHGNDTSRRTSHQRTSHRHQGHSPDGR